MSDERTPSHIAVRRIIRRDTDPIEASISTGGYTRDGSHDHYRTGTSVHGIEDRGGACFHDVPGSEEWVTICEGVQLRQRYPDPKDRDSVVLDLRVRRDVAPIYVHILGLEESWCDDAGFEDDSSRSSSWVYAIKLDAGPASDSDGGP